MTCNASKKEFLRFDIKVSQLVEYYILRLLSLKNYAENLR